MRKLVFGCVLACFIGSQVSPISAQTGPQSGIQPGNRTTTSAPLDDAKKALQEVEDVIVITESRVKKKKDSPAPLAEKKPPEPDTAQRLETLKAVRDQLRTKIERAEQARNPAEAQVLARDAALQASSARALSQNIAGTVASPSGLVERAIVQRFGSPTLEKLRETAQGGCGAGAPCAHTVYDFARDRRTAAPDPVAPAPDRIMQGAFSPPPVSGRFKQATPESAREAVQRYGSQFGGVVLEGIAEGLAFRKVEYNQMANALVVNESAVYFSPIPPAPLATLVRAIAKDARIGVSLSSTHIVTPSLPAESDVALDIKIADRFFGDIAFARSDWTRGYRFANGYQPQEHVGQDFHVAIYFIFNGFNFVADREELRAVRAGFDVSLVPLSDNRAPDGGLLPDEDAIRRKVGSRQYEANARHVAENIAYYRQEKIIDRVFAYGEVAALLRAMKNDGRDLNALARAIESANGLSPVTAARSPEAPDMRSTSAYAANLWDHNNSVMRLEASGATRRFYYQQPREGMLQAGVQPGSLLFDGRQVGNQIAGTAYVFARRCGQQPYQVEGGVSADGTIMMHGNAPRVNWSTCQVVGYRADELIFTPRGEQSAAAAGPNLWDHNNSLMTLQQSGANVRFYYYRPREGMLQAGAQPGSLLFNGNHSGAQIWGTAYVFSHTCGPQAYQVRGEIRDRGATVVMQGQVPRVDPSTCQLMSYRPDELVFTARAVAVPQRPEVVQMQNHWITYLKEIQERREYPNWSGPPYDLYRNNKAG